MWYLFRAARGTLLKPLNQETLKSGQNSHTELEIEFLRPPWTKIQKCHI
jgi:hypothetical protein